MQRLPLGLVEALVGLAQRLPGGHFWVPGPADWWLVGFYGGLAALAAFPRLRPPRRWCLALLAAWVTIGFAAGDGRDVDRGGLHCTFLAVGHGGAEVLELPSGQTMLYDAGEFGAPAAATRTIAGFLWSRGITHLDAVVLSHADVDHYNGLPGVLERFSVGAIYVTPQMFEKHNPAIRLPARRHRPQRRPAARSLVGAAVCRRRRLHDGSDPPAAPGRLRQRQRQQPRLAGRVPASTASS